MGSIHVIVGLPRSGTTLFQKILNSDPDVTSHEETWLLPHLSNLILQDNLSSLNSKTARNRSLLSSKEIFNLYKNLLESRYKFTHYIDKTPRNYMCPDVLSHFKHLYIVVRNPRDLFNPSTYA